MADEEIKETESLADKNNAYQWTTSDRFRENIAASTSEQWMNDVDDDKFKILDPDDPLMQRFQNALKAHLTRLDDRLTDEIRELEATIKEKNKTREQEGIILFDVQQQAAQQHTSIENYKHMLAEAVNLKGNAEENVKKLKEFNKKVNDELDKHKLKEKNLQQSIESFDVLQKQFTKWETELAANLTISQRISEKDAAVERELLYQKQQKDFVLYKLEDEIFKLQSEIKDLVEQIEMKNQEKVNLGQTIADANADLEGLEKEHHSLYGAWKNVLHLISQRDIISDEIIAEQKKLNESLKNLESQFEKVKKDSRKEMENNEHLTSLQTRISDEIKLVKRFYDSDKDKFSNLESDFIKFSKLMQQNEKEFNSLSLEYKSILQDEKSLNKEIMQADKKKRDIEEDILSKLDDKVSYDNTIRHLNKLMHELKDFNVENELNLSRFENTYGKCLLEMEKLNSLIESEKFDLVAATQKNIEKEKESDSYQNEIKNSDMLFKQKERKVAVLNKKIDEIIAISGREEASPLDLKIITLENNIDEIAVKIKKAQQYWLRHQVDIFTLSEEKNIQMTELGNVTKQIMLMEQKNIKLENELEKQKKEEANISRAISALQYKLVQINLRLASQKELKNELEDKNAVTKTEYISSLKDAETELIKLQTDIKQLNNDKVAFKEELKFSQQESLSWEKKLQLVNEINKACKEKKGAGGDIAIMKTEIHKMELRFSQLQKAQEKLVQDMESCIFKRDNIMDDAITREKRNPKNQHNQRIVLKKRIEEQRKKVKQILKEIKQIDNKMKDLESEEEKFLEYLNEGQKVLRQNEDLIPDLKKKILEAELIKNHNLEILVRKQRRIKHLRDVKDGQYKLLIKNETALSEEWKNQQTINNNLKEIMRQTQNDFPLLNYELQKIIFTLETS